MFKFPKSLLSVMIALVVFATVLPGMSYAGNDGTQVIKDNDEVRIAQTVQNGVVTKATLDKKTNILTIEEEGKEKIVLNVDALSNQYIDKNRISDTPSSEIGLMATNVKQDTFSNYEYTIYTGSPEKWQVRRPDNGSIVYYKYKDVTRTTLNATTLDLFQNTVEKIDALEWTFLGGAATTVSLSWVSFVLSVPTAGAGTLTAGLAALGAYGATLTTAVALQTQFNYAETYYGRL